MSQARGPRRRWGAALVVTALAACATKPPPPVRLDDATLFITAELAGAIEPCGCSAAMRGGLARLLGVIAAERATGRAVHFFDAGDLLFPPGAIAEAALPQQEAKAAALARAFAQQGLAARLPGPGDLRRGPDFLAARGLPALPSPQAQRPYASVTVGGSRIAVVGAATLPEAQAAGALARRDGAGFVVAFVLAPFEALAKQLGADDDALDLVVAARAKDELTGELNRALGTKPRLVQVQTKGRSLLRVDLKLAGPLRPTWAADDAARQRELSALDERIEQLRGQVNEPGLADDFKALKQAKLDEVVGRRQLLAQAPVTLPPGASAVARAIPIEAALPEPEGLRALVAEYDRAVGEMNLAWAKAHGEDCPAPTPAERGFVGSATCEACHPLAGQAWRKTKHFGAYAALAAQGKQYHLDCVACHLTGWQQKGGVCHVADFAGFEHVGCEACHGGGSLHVTTTKKEDIDRTKDGQVCLRCHDHENSPHFDYATYAPQLIVPGHGLPPPAPPPTPATP